MEFESLPQNNRLDKNILSQKEIGLRELFKNSENPVEVI